MAERRDRIDLYVGPALRISREELPAYEKTGKWVAELKHDGVWCVSTVQNGTILTYDSRVGLPHPRGIRGLTAVDPKCSPGSGQVVGELCEDTLYLFELLNWNGFDFRDIGLEERREALEMVYAATFRTDRVQLVERREVGFLAWYDEIMAGNSKVKGERAEGLVLKKRGSINRATRSDGKVDFQIKCKPLNTVDYVVIGPDGTAKKGTKKIALGLYFKVGGKLEKCMSPTWPAGMDLNPGDVVEVEGAEVFPSGAVRHGHIKRKRPDKKAEDCTLTAAMEA